MKKVEGVPTLFSGVDRLAPTVLYSTEAADDSRFAKL